VSDQENFTATEGTNGDLTAIHHPSVEISRTATGKHTWRIRTYAIDYTPAALIEAKDLAVRLDGELAGRLA
jgi:hypothetical protein